MINSQQQVLIIIFYLAIIKILRGILKVVEILFRATSFLVQQHATCVHGGVKIHLVELPAHPFYFSQLSRRNGDKKIRVLRKFGRLLPNKMLVFYNFIG